MDLNDLNGIVKKVAKPFLVALNIYLGFYATVFNVRKYYFDSDVHEQKFELIYAILFGVYTCTVIWFAIKRKNHLYLVPILVVLFVSYFILG
jgi:5-hydroxyisourate hydrolase-like protein (transthyretin family)